MQFRHLDGTEKACYNSTVEPQLPSRPAKAVAPSLAIPDTAEISPLRGTRFLTLVMRQQHAIIEGRQPTEEDARRILAMMRAAAPNPIAVLGEYGEWIVDPSGEEHFLWHGPCNKSGTPIMYHWYDPDGTHHKDYPVYKILWASCRSDPLTRSVKKMAICDQVNCANPACYEKQFVMHYPAREASSRSQRQRRRADLGARKGRMWPEQIIHRPDGFSYVVCESKHVLKLTPEEALQRIGEQVYCQECEYVDRAYREAPHPERESHKGMVLYTNPSGEVKWISEDVYRAIVKDPFDVSNPALPASDDVDEDALLAMFDTPADGVDNAT